MSFEKVTISRETLGEAAYRYLFQGFLSKQLVPGTRLRMDELAQQMGISRTPVREALQRLEREGVIEPHGGRGYVVCAVTTEEIDSRYEAREAIEGFAIRRVTELGGSAAASVRAGFQQILLQPQSNAEEVFLANRGFHRLIVEVSGNSHLVDAFDQLWNRVLTSNIWTRMLNTHDVVKQFEVDHIPLVEAIESGDPALAYKLMVEHIHDGRTLHEL